MSRKEKKQTVGKAALRGSVRKATVRPSKKGKVISLQRTYSASDKEHQYDIGGSSTLRKEIQSERMMSRDAVGGTRTQRKIIKTEGKVDRTRSEVNPYALRKVKKHASIRINGKEVGNRIAGGTKRGYQVGKGSIKGIYAQTSGGSASFGQKAEGDKAATEAGAYISGAAGRAGRTAERTIGKVSFRDKKTQTKIKKLEKQLDKNGKKLYKADKKLGRSVKANNRAIKQLEKKGMLTKENGGVALRGGMTGSVKVGGFLRTDRRVLRTANQKSVLMENQKQITQKLKLLRKKSNPLESLVRRLTVGIVSIALLMGLPILFVLMVLGGGQSDGGRIDVIFDEDAPIVASYIFDNRKEIFPEDGKKGEYDILRLSAILAAISAQTSADDYGITISHKFNTTKLDTKFPGKSDTVKGSGWQGLCGWTNEEIAQFIEEEQAAGRYAGYDEGTGVADLYTQCHYLKKKLIEMKNDRQWKNANTVEEMAVICYNHLILQKTPISLEVQFNKTNNMVDGCMWTAVYTIAYQYHLQSYDVWSREIAEQDYDTPSGRGKVCYPSASTTDYKNRWWVISTVSLPRLATVTTKDENGHEIEKDKEKKVSIRCHWLITSRLYESFYEAVKAGYKISESAYCYTDNPNDTDSLYSYGLAFSINQAENTPDQNGECHDSKWGNVIDDDLANIFKDHGFYWSLENDPPGPRWEFRFVKQMPND